MHEVQLLFHLSLIYLLGCNKRLEACRKRLEAAVKDCEPVALDKRQPAPLVHQEVDASAIVGWLGVGTHRGGKKEGGGGVGGGWIFCIWRIE